MVVNLCLPHFETTANCNKLCADGCDVSNLLSGDPAARRRGFKLEYFLRPPVHVTLHFQMKVKLYRVDIELWPCGNVPRRLEIHTSSDLTKTVQHEQESGHFWLVGRCDLNEEVLTCFQHPNFKHRTQTQFTEPPPEPPIHARQEELWSRGFHSLSSVTQLRITVPYCAASTVLGIKSLAVWGVPADCCTASEVEKFQKALFNSLQPRHFPLLSPASTSAKSPSPDPDSSETQIPDEFLDPLTQELMILPMILPSGMVVDNSTLEEYQKREATWGRLPNDPFTGVPFTKESKPLPNPLLKSRIDSLILQTGCTGIGNRSSRSEAQPSRLVTPSAAENDQTSTQRSQRGIVETQTQRVCSGSSDFTENLRNQLNNENKGSGLSESKVQSNSSIQQKPEFILASVSRMTSISGRSLGHSIKRKYQSTISSSSANISTLSPLYKMPKTDGRTDHATETNSSQASHEQRLSQSLDDALSSALQGLPTYTSQSNPKPDGAGGQSRCGSCSSSLDIYSSPVAYSLPCGHLLCRVCLHREHSSSSQRLPCPTCRESASPSAIMRVHH
ncbi:RING finger protein 37 [Trichomycterus rosablanca]|uniref:RING finger protein 37 n=1 Tax=Trichomycterus rosablanca TaxID=2290929 RepID=UPI002F35CBAE